LDAQAAVQIEQVHKAAQQNVLAIIDQLGIAGRDRKGGGAAAQERAGFVEMDIEAGAAQGGGGGQARRRL
jgi:hypothetical protein